MVTESADFAEEDKTSPNTVNKTSNFSILGVRRMATYGRNFHFFSPTLLSNTQLKGTFRVAETGTNC